MTEVAGQVHITEAELAGDVHGALLRVQQGLEVVIEKGDRPVAIMRAPLGAVHK
jgi:antitoxin (DNA-binding transcriptional repressor) of toxin-antitoxin stability system